MFQSGFFLKFGFIFFVLGVEIHPEPVQPYGKVVRLALINSKTELFVKIRRFRCVFDVKNDARNALHLHMQLWYTGARDFANATAITGRLYCRSGLYLRLQSAGKIYVLPLNTIAPITTLRSKITNNTPEMNTAFCFSR